MSRRLRFDDLSDTDGNGGERNRRVGERDRRNLIPATADTARAFFHGLTHQPTDSQRDVTDFQASDDSEGRIERQTDNRAANAEENSADKSRVAVFRRLGLHFFRAAIAGEHSIDAVIGTANGLLATDANVAVGGGLIFRGAELRSAGHNASDFACRDRVRVGHSITGAMTRRNATKGQV